MALTMSGNNTNATDMRGVFVQESRIVNINDLSGKQIFDKLYDLAIELEVTTGFEWNKKILIKGNFKYSEKDPDSIDNWGGAFVVREFFKSLRFFDNLNAQETTEKMAVFQQRQIPVDFIARLFNQKIYILSYVSGWNEEKGKARYYTWNIVGLDRDKLLSNFKESLTKGYPRNYDPEALDGMNTDFSYGANLKNSDGNDLDLESEDRDFTL